MLFVCVLGVRVTYMLVISGVIPFIPELLHSECKSSPSWLAPERSPAPTAHPADKLLYTDIIANVQTGRNRHKKGTIKMK